MLSAHDRSESSYLVFLTIEEHEKGTEKKVHKLISQFMSKFRHIHFTVHKLRSHEQKSEVSWCLENVAKKLSELMISEEDVLVTVVDANSWVPHCYFY